VAGDVLTRLKDEDPLSVETRGFELEFHLESGRLEDAARLADQLCRSFPSSSRLQFLAGKTAYRRRKYAAALPHFQESHRMVAHWRSLQWTGKTLTQLGRFEKALDCLERARTKNPFIDGDLAWLHERMGNLEKAIKALQRLLELVPNDQNVSERLIKLKGKMLEPKALIEEIQELEKLGEMIPNHLFSLYIENLIRCGEIEHARTAVDSCREHVDGRTALDLAWVCYRMQQFDLAFDLFLSQLETNTTNFKMLNSLENAARKTDRLEKLEMAYTDMGRDYKNLLGRAKKLHLKKRS